MTDLVSGRCFFQNDKEIVPSLKEALDAVGLSFEKVSPSFPAFENKYQIADRHEVLISDGEKVAQWKAPRLSELFRGNVVPPNLEKYPSNYVPAFFSIERPIYLVASEIGAPTDREMEEIYSNLRRRPDGRSLGLLHDVAWQSAAYLLGVNEVSRAEFEAIFTRLSLSVAAFRTGLVSRNYFAHLASYMGSADEY